MGHFSVACGISNLSIHEGDEIGFVILGDGRIPDPRMNVDGGKSFHLYSNDRFSPYLPPVFGTYSGYGELENIEKSNTTEVMEEIFGIPVEKVFSILTCSRSIYDTSSEIFKAFYKGSRRFGNYQAPMEEALVPLGFEKDVDASSEDVEVFNYETLSVKIRTEGYFKKWTVCVKGTDLAIAPEFTSGGASDGLSLFHIITGLMPGYPKDVQEKVKHLKNLNGMFILKDVFVKMSEYLKEPGVSYEFGKPREQQWDEFIAVMDAVEKEGRDFETFYPMIDIVRAIEHGTSLQKQYIPLLRKYGKSYAYLDIMVLLEVMTVVNRMFAPTFCGEQDGNNEASQRLNRVTDKILAERRVRFGADEDDYED
jgi:hypothetical protein